MKRFVEGKYGRQTMRFYPAPFQAPLRAFAVLVFAWREDEVLVCDITGRGWCVPSGRVEPDESSCEAGLREAIEEAGAVLGGLQYIGCYEIRDRNEIRWADCYTGTVSELGEITVQEESKGRKFVTLSELPSLYHLWNDLTAQVFDHASEVSKRASEWKS